jgi:uncharacterized protein (DUF4415 family)
MDRKQQLEKFAKMQDKDIDFSDIPDIEDGLSWRPNPLFRPVKQQITTKLDKDIVLWLKLHGDMTKFLNKICREKMLEERLKK